MAAEKHLRGKVFVDTNILIYATLSKDSRHEKAKEALAWRKRRDLDFYISVQNLAEMYPNLTGPKNQPPDDPALARKKIQSIQRLQDLTILSVTLETTELALELCERRGLRRQHYFDMQLVASMLLEGIPTILTENETDFQGIESVQSLNPLGP